MRSEQEVTRYLDRVLVWVADHARPLPSLSPENAASERARLVQCLEMGEVPVPVSTAKRGRVDGAVYREIDQARTVASGSPLGTLYADRLCELELDLAILEAWGEPKRVRPLCVRRYGSGNERVPARDGLVSLVDLARSILSDVAPLEPEARPLPPVAGRGKPSVASLVLRAAVGVGLDPDVRVEPRLASLAATGERTVFLAQRMFGLREARRLVAHEVFGHLVTAANARAQSLRLLQVGLKGAFADQEGAALYLEAALGLMCADRLRTLAGRVVATRALHEGASYGETARLMYRQHGFSAEASVLMAERAFRGGGVARDAGYLAGFVRVRAAVEAGEVSLDELRRGRVALAQVPLLREHELAGHVSPPCYRPSLARSRELTLGGTSSDTSPPSEAASFTMFELT